MENIEEVKIVEKPKRQKAITQKELDDFKREMITILDDRLRVFIDDFLNAWQDSNHADEHDDKNDKPCSCDLNGPGEPVNNPRRYMIQAGSNPWWVDNFKPSALAGLDVIWTEELGGKIKTVRGTIMSQDISIFDFESDMDLETFDNIKKATIEYAIQTAQEAQAREKADKSMAKQEQCTDTSSHVSYG